MNAQCTLGRRIACIIALILLDAAVVLSAPVTIDETKYHVTILREGQCEILYEITFTELESRDRMRTIGQFIEPMKFIESYGTHRGKRFGVDMQSIGNGYYSAVFDITTKTNEKYIVSMRYLVERPVLDRTEFNNITYGKLWWSPIQWSLPIGRQTVEMVLPIEIAARYNRPELITNQVLGPTGLLEDGDTKKAYQRWIYYPTPWKGKNYLSLHAEKNNLSPNEKNTFNLYVPARYLNIGAQGGDYTLDAVTAGGLLDEGDYSIEEATGLVTVSFMPGNNQEIDEISTVDLLIKEKGKRNIF